MNLAPCGRGPARVLVFLALLGMASCGSGPSGGAGPGAPRAAVAGPEGAGEAHLRNGNTPSAAQGSALAFLDGREAGMPSSPGSGRPIEWFAAVLNAAMRESRELGPRLELAARWVVANGGEGDLCRAVAEVDHRVCCLRAGFVAAALQGLAAGVFAHSDADAVCRDAETLARLEKLAHEGAAEVRSAAGRLLAILLEPSATDGAGGVSVP